MGEEYFPVPDFEMTLLRSSQMSFGVGFPLPISICGEISVRQDVACNPARGDATCKPSLSAVAGHMLGSFSDVLTSSGRGKALASFQPLLCCTPAKLRPSGLLKPGANADRRLTLSQPHRSVHTLLKVSNRGGLTQSRNSGNNLQLSEKLFDGREFRHREFRRRRPTVHGVEQ
jgi:hypothetical protein